MGYQDRGYYQSDQDVDLRPSWNQQSAVAQLIILNVIVFVVNLLFGNPSLTNQGSVNEALALGSDTLWKPWLWFKTITYAFAHSSTNIGHIFFNMLSLYFMGRSVESRYGRVEFLKIYLLAALFCGVGSMIFRGLGSDAATVLGASGAVLCISMLFVYNYPNATVYFIVFPMPAWVLGVIFVLTNFFSSSGPGIAYDVHLLGILFATLYFFLGWSFTKLQDPRQGIESIQRWWKRRKFKLHPLDDDASLSEQELEAKEADRILEKIHASGKDSLTGREKKFLEKYSQSVRNKKRLDS